MCGLNFSFDPDESKVKKMNDLISHRGLPGRLKIKTINNHTFGHVRLPIQGLSSQYDQPYIYNGYLFLFVGEIFNYKILDPDANSDIEVLAKFWCQYNINAFSFFDGFWSVIIHDIKNKETHIILDQLAKKPLYMNVQTLDISSELKALAPFVDSPQIDDLYFSSTAKWGYTIGSQTFDKNIVKLESNTHYIITKEKNTIVIDDDFPLIKNTSDDLRAAVNNAVINRAVSDIPISILCSGGLDSSIIFKLLSQHTHNITVYHIDNGEDQFLTDLEIPPSISMHKIVLDYTNLPISEILYANESPFDLGSMIPQYLLGQAIVKDNIHIAISGDGADELFGGYTRAQTYDSQYSDIFEELVYYHLPRLDKMMMFSTVELRCPFLSFDVLAHALKIPYSERHQKECLKNIFKDILPESIITRPKLPLKSKFVLADPLRWRLELIDRFREETMNVYYRA